MYPTFYSCIPQCNAVVFCQRRRRRTTAKRKETNSMLAGNVSSRANNSHLARPSQVACSSCTIVGYYSSQCRHTSVADKTKRPHHWHFNNLLTKSTTTTQFGHPRSARFVYMMLGASTCVTEVCGAATDATTFRKFQLVSEISFSRSPCSALYSKHEIGNSEWVSGRFRTQLGYER